MNGTARWAVTAAVLAITACSSRSPEKVCKHYQKLAGSEFDDETMKQCKEGAEAFLDEHGNAAYKALADCVLAADSIEETADCESRAREVASRQPEGDEPGAVGRYKARSQGVEAKVLVKKMYEGARAYWRDPPMSADSMMAPAAPQFPESVAPTPPPGRCCEQGGKCAPDASAWTHPTWTALMFSVDDPHYYSYAFESTQGEPGAVDGSHSFRALAYGDLDCDGQYSTFEIRGAIDENNPDGPAGAAEVVTHDELE